MILGKNLKSKSLDIVLLTRQKIERGIGHDGLILAISVGASGLCRPLFACTQSTPAPQIL